MQSMDTIYQQYAQVVYRYLLSLTRDSDLAEELTQETFYQAIRSSGKYDESCKITTWLCGIAKNVLLTWRRKHPIQKSLEELPKEAEGEERLRESSAESKALAEFNRMQLLQRIHDLPDPYKEVIYLRIFGDLSFKEIGEVMGKTETWARVTFYRGKSKLTPDSN